MYKINDYVVYKRDVCIVKDIKDNYRNNEGYYILYPIDDDSLKIEVPISNKQGFLRNLITYDEAINLINCIPKIETISCNDKLLEAEYKNLLNSLNHKDLIKIIKTSYTKNKERIDNKKKIISRDEKYFKLAEKYLYNELSIVLNKTIEETKEFIQKKAYDFDTYVVKE